MTDAPTGHIKISRKAFDAEHGDPFWLESRSFSRFEAWVDVIQLAAFKPYRQTTQHFGVIDLLRGEFVASLRWLAARWQWTMKRVRYWLATCEKGARIRAQRETPAGTVYLIVNYDAYQSQGHSKGTAKGTPKGDAGAQQGHKIEAVKAVSTTKAPASPAPTPIVRVEKNGSSLESLPKSTVDATWKRWSARIGAVNYGSLRKALLPAFDAQPRVYSDEQMANAVEAFAEAMEADDPKWRDKWTERKFARDLHYWVKLGSMEPIDEWGGTTERGRAAGISLGGA